MTKVFAPTLSFVVTLYQYITYESFAARLGNSLQMLGLSIVLSVRFNERFIGDQVRNEDLNANIYHHIFRWWMCPHLVRKMTRWRGLLSYFGRSVVHSGDENSFVCFIGDDFRLSLRTFEVSRDRCIDRVITKVITAWRSNCIQTTFICRW